MNQAKINDLLFADLCFKIIGCAFKVHNAIGGEQLEKHYQKALAIEFNLCGIKFNSQEKINLVYKDIKIGMNIPDFVVEESIIIEIKSNPKFTKSDFNQMNRYLQATGKKLGILINFGKEKVTFRRVLNIND